MNRNQSKERYSKSLKHFNTCSSEDDDSDSYQNALKSSLVSIFSSKSEDSISDEKGPTESRIEFIRNILDTNKLKPMIDFDSCDTESVTNTKLGKKIMDIRELFTSMNVKLKYLKSGTTGHTFKATSKIDKNIAFAVKVCAYPKDDYGGINNLSRPENAELRMLKLLGYFVVKKSTPHFVLPIGTFNTSITNFIKVPTNVIDLSNEKNDMYNKFIKRYHNGEFEDFVSVLISEWCNGGDLLDYIRKNYETMTLKVWVIIFFQILFTLSLIHEKYPAFRHNDMKANNILVQITDIKKHQSSDKYRYRIGDTVFYIPNINLQIKIWDFDFACIDGIIENNKVNAEWTKKINISKKENKYYDMHYFFNTLTTKRFFPQFYEGGVPQEIIDFVHRIIPEKFRNIPEEYRNIMDKYYNIIERYDEIPQKYKHICEAYSKIPQKYHKFYKYVNKKGRIQVDTEYTTPYKVITEDPLFKKYRFNVQDTN